MPHKKDLSLDGLSLDLEQADKEKLGTLAELTEITERNAVYIIPESSEVQEDLSTPILESGKAEERETKTTRLKEILLIAYTNWYENNKIVKSLFDKTHEMQHNRFYFSGEETAKSFVSKFCDEQEIIMNFQLIKVEHDRCSEPQSLKYNKLSKQCEPLASFCIDPDKGVEPNKCDHDDEVEQLSACKLD